MRWDGMGWGHMTSKGVAAVMAAAAAVQHTAAALRETFAPSSFSLSSSSSSSPSLIYHSHRLDRQPTNERNYEGLLASCCSCTSKQVMYNLK